MDRKRLVLLVLLGLFIVISVAVVLVERNLEENLKTALEEGQISEVDISILRNRITMKQASLELEELQLSVDEIIIAGVNMFALLAREELKVKELRLSGARAVYFPDRKDTTEASVKLDQLVSVSQINVENSSIRIEKQGEDVLALEIPIFGLEGVEVDSRSLESPIPLRYEQYHLKVDSIVAQLDSRHTLLLEELELTNVKTVARNLQVVPKYSKDEFQQHIPHELDRYDLGVAEIRMDSLQFRFMNDSLTIQIPLMEIDSPVLEVYRDKLQADDPSKKLLYSAQLRNISAILGLEHVLVRDGHITYLERVHQDRDPIKVEFTELDASIRNLRNHPLDGEVLSDTEIEVETVFMGEAPLEVTWGFNVADVGENFRIRGSFNNLPSDGINNLLEPAMNVKATGGISYLAFDFEGNDDRALGEMQLQYEDFSVEVLRKDGSEKSGFLSAIANLFVNSSTNNDEVTHSGLEVERVKNKSFWNFLWLCIREGALDSFL